MRAGAIALLAGLLLGGPAWPNVPPGTPETPMDKLKDAAQRFPQPVEVSALPGRYVVEPNEEQRVLGRVAPEAVVKDPGGALRLVIRRGGVLGIGATTVAVAVDDVALSGTLVVLVGLTPAAFQALPGFSESDVTRLPSRTSLPMGIVGPFH